LQTWMDSRQDASCPTCRARFTRRDLTRREVLPVRGIHTGR
jgi:hypothetical protein